MKNRPDYLSAGRITRKQIAGKPESNPTKAEIDNEQIPLPLGGNIHWPWVRPRFACDDCGEVRENVKRSDRAIVEMGVCPACGRKGGRLVESWE